MKLRSRLTGTVLIGTLTMFGLAACGSDDSTKDDSDKKDSSSEKTDDSDDSDDSSSEADGDKPSKDDVVAGYTAALEDLAGGQVPEGTLDDMVTCIIDGVYDKISAESLQAMASSDIASVAPEDGLALADATGTCTQELMPQ